ncbi:hypothetical protein [Bradyrhizobium elkanii]|uniref:hypothetical protein n=1 Tax=Bradyrhizobium elkanii TaxID=29448 RepID=UPI0004B7EF91|nr:hypothetical protein [Bradyrhizobium elkanii]
MKYNQPYGVSDANAPYVNGDPSIGRAGSIPPAASIEYPQREIVNLINAAGLTPDNADLAQLARGIQSGQLIYAVDTGTATAYAIALTPPLLQYYDGLFVWVIPSNSNSGPATLNINGLGAKNIVRRGGALLSPGDMPKDYRSLLCYNSIHGNFELYGTGFTVGGFLPVLTANTTWYVNASTGDDSLYDGTTPTVSAPHGPFKTITRAMNEVFKYGPSVYTATIQVAAGTYNENVYTPSFAGPFVIIRGAGKTQTFVTGVNNNHTFISSHGNTMMVQDLCGSTGTGTGPPCLFTSAAGGSIYTDNTASNFVQYSVWEAYTGYVFPGSHDFNAGTTCTYVLAAFFNSFIGFQQNKTYNFLGTYTMSGCFAAASSGGTISVPVPYTPVFNNPGFVSGQKFQAVVNGVINTQGLGVNFFPGTTAGTTGQGGQYV